MHEFLARVWRGLVAHVDAPLLLITLTLMAVGLTTVYSATYDANSHLLAQMLNMAIGLCAMWTVAQVPPQKLMRFGVPLYLVGVVLLILVFFFGIKVNGARRWLSLGFTRIQPSEVLKIAVPLMLAWYFHKNEAVLKFRHYVVASLLLLVPFALIAKQPDLGTAILVGAAGFYVIFFAGLPWRVIGGLLAIASAATPFAWGMLHDYQRKRILTLVDPTTDPLGSGYHIIQSTIAIGSGGKVGKGWLAGTQTHLEFIPERHTDFILAVFSEERGLLGNGILLLLYLLMIGRGLMIAARASTLFGRVMAGSVTLSLFTYVFVNMGMVSGILPVVGVPLPFMSYGGTALVTLSVGIGILMSINTHRMLVRS
ncbi:MAG: Rod shape-determining protein RodA [Candidatus Accumulibacter regalis]|jgi:rod shape determining protein RodA|uniref:Peptidoglycan glycosyltransferase MrdB n=1 Tax=Accumulibacter regalis TaxID=522306 RepID=A0A011RCU4_ACCRE|nr:MULTISPECIES: rod shape-determining protein RodA [unclassified Candidatus Accumulibacter]EXI89064.1 MAG: Rod shape-determining protein RodA [Candidatus Accumulibacter regalis]MQM33523.1 rod shape-determining protein RodA [Candidatus Accumulibacter phosphatis]MBL8367058.1 rod shape-determining protein RodA [Accumulibacter sp.]MBN8515998.1 rod shape-determining protein RodA [Accumulibacter sp.]MBO3702371.1 rod shape-determining protein RodA [Accumulibacter sp.]